MMKILFWAGISLFVAFLIMFQNRSNDGEEKIDGENLKSSIENGSLENDHPSVEAKTEGGSGKKNDVVPMVTKSKPKVEPVLTSREKTFAKVMMDFKRGNQVQRKQWMESLGDLLQPDTINYGELLENKNYVDQIDALKSLLKAAKQYKKHVDGQVVDLENRLKGFDENFQPAREALEAFATEHLNQKPLVEPLVKTSIEYGAELIYLIDFLRKNDHRWTLEKTGPVTKNPSLLAQFNEKLRRCRELELQLKSLLEKLP